MSSYYNLPEILIKEFIKKRYVVFVDTDPFKKYHIIHFEKFEDKLKTVYKMYILYACDNDISIEEFATESIMMR